MFLPRSYLICQYHQERLRYLYSCYCQARGRTLNLSPDSISSGTNSKSEFLSWLLSSWLPSSWLLVFLSPCCLLKLSSGVLTISTAVPPLPESTKLAAQLYTVPCCPFQSLWLLNYILCALLSPSKVDPGAV
jgi:hypothetical protein